jgi:hypothetical protein
MILLNDSNGNGIYEDEQSLKKFNNVLTLEEGQKIMLQ